MSVSSTHQYSSSAKTATARLSNILTQTNFYRSTKAGTLCLRCHAFLDYPNSDRGALVSIVDRTHKRRYECVKCHNPHDPKEYYE